MMKNFDIAFLSKAIPNQRAFYDILSDFKGYYLPDWQSKAITEAYLLQVAKQQVFTLKKEDLKIGSLCRKAQIPDLMNILGENTELPLGFGKDSRPNKKWLVNCLHTVCPQHSLFHPKTSETERTCKLPEK